MPPSESLTTVKSAGVIVLWICDFTCFQIWLKTYTKCCTNNSLLSSNKTISFLLEMTYNMLSISECFGETLTVFDFDEKLTKLCTNNNVSIAHKKYYR